MYMNGIGNARVDLYGNILSWLYSEYLDNEVLHLDTKHKRTKGKTWAYMSGQKVHNL